MEMAGGGLWHKTLVYFGLSDEDEDYEDDTMSTRQDVESGYGERPERAERSYVKKIDRNSPGSRRRQTSDFDDIYSEDPYRGQRAPMPSSRTGSVRPLTAVADQPQVRVHLVMPKNFNDAQVIADKFKGDVPVILNLQSSESDLAKRLIDFASGLTYALDGGMQRVADMLFVLTPKNVEVSAEERQRMLEKGFFNQF
jgi:cell division inhibitor SepF